MTPRLPASAIPVAPAGDPYLPGHGNEGYALTRYELDLDYRVASNRLSGRARLHATTTEDLTGFTLDLAGMRVTKVLVNGRRAGRWNHRARKLAISLAAPVAAGTGLVIEIEYSGQPRPIVGVWGEVGWEELEDGVIVAAQPDGAASWFPCNDSPGAKASFQIAVTTESAYQVLCNGTLVEQTNRASKVRWVYDQPEPMAPYLATVQIGRYDLFTTADGPVPQRAAVPPRLRAAFGHDFARQADMMAVFAELFGPYPFAEYHVVVTDDDLDMPLEAQGMSVFGANHLDGSRGSERLVAHELAHQWFGNSLTVGAWRHIWLHEGFACYAEWLWSEGSGGRSAAELARAAWDRLDLLPQDLVIADPGPELMFDDRLYKRGALTLHALRVALGDSAFFELLRTWGSTYRHGTVSTGEFIECAARFAGRPLNELFRTWLFDSALPPRSNLRS